MCWLVLDICIARGVHDYRQIPETKPAKLAKAEQLFMPRHLKLNNMPLLRGDIEGSYGELSMDLGCLF